MFDVRSAFRTSEVRPRLAILTDWCVLAAAAILPITVAVIARDAPHIARVSIVNPTPYMLEMRASTPTDPTETLVTIIDPGESDAVEFVDRGDTWVLHFKGDGYEVLPIEVQRADFLDLSRPYAIPASVGQQIADQKQS